MFLESSAAVSIESSTNLDAPLWKTKMTSSSPCPYFGITEIIFHGNDRYYNRRGTLK